ncbi:hypothetical protein C6341_g25482 [Phytophthora cactorum]|nr:hypothetical protein C6341_g25482 [Phytophthora cactorum]
MTTLQNKANYAQSSGGEPMSKNKRLGDKQHPKLNKHRINMVEFRHKKKERFGRSKNEHQRLSV